MPRPTRSSRIADKSDRPQVPALAFGVEDPPTELCAYFLSATNILSKSGRTTRFTLNHCKSPGAVDSVSVSCFGQNACPRTTVGGKNFIGNLTDAESAGADMSQTYG